MNQEELLPILGIFVLICILILGIFSIKMILFPNKTYQEQEQESNDELEESLNNLTPPLTLERNSLKKILKTVDVNIKELKEIEMNKTLKEELSYQKLKKDEDLQIKINILKKAEQRKYFVSYLETLKKHSENLSDNEINDLLIYIETKFK